VEAGAVAGRNEAGRIGTDGGSSLGQNPFAALNATGLPVGSATSPSPSVEPAGSKRDLPNRNRGRVEIRRTTAGRGGKTVTVVSGFVGIGAPEKEELAKKMRAACGCGGTVKDGQIEIQGDNRDKVAAILTAAGFRPVFAGG
jgi:translation initiation factor 1